MANLFVKRVDPGQAARDVEQAIRETLPTVGVVMRTSGQAEQRSFLGAFGHGLGAYLRAREPGLFTVTADCSSPRPFRIHLQYVAVGRGAVATSILYLGRLRQVIPAQVGFKRGRFRSGTFDGDPAVAGVLGSHDGLAKTLWSLMQRSTMSANMVFTIEPFAELVPDAAGALFAARAAPARGRYGLGASRLDLARYLDIATRIETAIAAAPGVSPASPINVPLPD